MKAQPTTIRPDPAARPSFSLAELMVAIGILGIGLLMVAAAFPVAIDQVRQAVELQTSRLVFNEAVNNLKTQVSWMDLERYLDTDTTTGALERNQDPPNEHRVWRVTATMSAIPAIFVLSFDAVETDASPPGPAADFFTDAQLQNQLFCRYSADDTYGWLPAVQRIGNRTYRFWVFVIREPTGIVDNGGLRVTFANRTQPPAARLLPHTSRLPSSGRQIDIDPGINGGLHARQFVLVENGEVRRIAEVSTSDDTVSCNRDTLSIEDLNLTYVVPRAGANLTRRNPTIAVYQTVITY